jgi:hypothetical protein
MRCQYRIELFSLCSSISLPSAAALKPPSFERASPCLAQDEHKMSIIIEQNEHNISFYRNEKETFQEISGCWELYVWGRSDSSGIAAKYHECHGQTLSVLKYSGKV